jgi:hypothetical protein
VVQAQTNTEGVSVTDIEIARYALRTFKEGSGKDGSELVSASMAGSYWSDGTCKATCQSGNTAQSELHAAPHESCSCGIYGTLSLSHLMSQYGYLASKLVAVFAAEGDTIIGDRGLRTAYARVVAYWCGHDSEKIRETANRQFVGAKEFTNLHAMLSEFEFPTEDFALDGSVNIKWSFEQAVPDRSKPSTNIFTVYNMAPGSYSEVKLADGYVVPITPVVFSGQGGCLVVSFNWTPCTVPDCKGCPACQ